MPNMSLKKNPMPHQEAFHKDEHMKKLQEAAIRVSGIDCQIGG